MERHIDRIGRVLIATVIILWILSQFSDALKRWVLEEGLLNVIMIALLVEVISYIVEIKQKSSRGSSRIFKNQFDARQEFEQFIREQKPKKADLIELSSVKIDGLLERLDANCDIRLLIQHPQKAVSKLESKRIVDQLCRLQTNTLKDHNKVNIKCYCVPASIRGRNIDEKLLNIGWYTYSGNKEIKVTGHANPMINVYTDTREGRILKEFFTKAFDQLWEQAVPFEDALKAIEEKPYLETISLCTPKK
jgi:hypothetical protein